MKTLLHWLRRPYPYEEGWWHPLRTAAWAGLFVWLFLFFFKPFGTRIAPGEEGPS